MENLIKVGDKIKTWEVIKILERKVVRRISYNKKKLVLVRYALLLSEGGQERVLEIREGKKLLLTDCETYISFGKNKYKTHSMI